MEEPEHYVLFAKLPQLSPTGRLHTRVINSYQARIRHFDVIGTEKLNAGNYRQLGTIDETPVGSRAIPKDAESGHLQTVPREWGARIIRS